MEFNPILNLDIGGQKFRVLRETVMKFPSSLLAQVITGKDVYHMLIVDNSYFFDRNPQYFSVVLDYMRTGKFFLPVALLQDQLQEELKFWKIDNKFPMVQNNFSNIEATLIIPDYEPTLIIPETIEPTVLTTPIIESTMLLNSPNIEPTLIIDNSTTEIPIRNSFRDFRNASSTQNEVKKPEKKIELDTDDLLSSILPNNNSANRTLPWANKDLKKPAGKPVPKPEPIKEKKVVPVKQVEKVKNSNEISYESSFIDDLSVDSGDFKPTKRKKLEVSKPQKKLHKTPANKCKKAVVPSAEELSKALKNMR